MLNAKNGLSAMQAARDLEMRRPTVWSMMHRIRGAMADDGKLLTGLVEMDEAYVGGKPRRTNRKDDNDPKPRGRGTSKNPVVGALDRRKCHRRTAPNPSSHIFQKCASLDAEARIIPAAAAAACARVE